MFKNSRFVLGYGCLIRNTDKNRLIVKSQIPQFSSDKVGVSCFHYEHDRKECEFDIIFSKFSKFGEFGDPNLGNGLFGPIGPNWMWILGITIDPTEREIFEFKQYLLEKEIVKSEHDFGAKLNCWLQGINY